MPSAPGAKLDIRLGPELRATLQRFQADNGIENMSAAARTLISLGLERSSELDAAWRRLAWREGTVAAQSKFKMILAKVINEVLGDQ